MPSMRPHPLNPRPPAVPGTRQTFPAPSTQVVPAAPPVGVPTPAAAPAADGDSPAETAARAGGFHESSYELQNGLQVSESEWPDDVTVPGALGER